MASQLSSRTINWASFEFNSFGIFINQLITRVDVRYFDFCFVYDLFYSFLFFNLILCIFIKFTCCVSHLLPFIL